MVVWRAIIIEKSTETHKEAKMLLNEIHHIVDDLDEATLRPKMLEIKKLRDSIKEDVSAFKRIHGVDKRYWNRKEKDRSLKVIISSIFRVSIHHGLRTTSIWFVFYLGIAPPQVV